MEKGCSCRGGQRGSVAKMPAWAERQAPRGLSARLGSCLVATVKVPHSKDKEVTGHRPACHMRGQFTRQDLGVEGKSTGGHHFLPEGPTPVCSEMTSGAWCGGCQEGTSRGGEARPREPL